MHSEFFGVGNFTLNFVAKSTTQHIFALTAA